MPLPASAATSGMDFVAYPVSESAPTSHIRQHPRLALSPPLAHCNARRVTNIQADQEQALGYPNSPPFQVKLTHSRSFKAESMGTDQLTRHGELGSRPKPKSCTKAHVHDCEQPRE